jgi:PHD/YefM family antitoxin component YafN of YafNO toxin-antitoxin module
MAELEQQTSPLYVTQHGKPKAVLSRYDEYEALIQKLEDFEDLLAIKESLAAPEKEAISLEEYERRRATRVRS